MKTAPSIEAQHGVAGPITNIEDMRRELQASRDRELLLRNELAHRVRNILAITRSLFSRTFETADTLEHAADHFRGRLDALARYHGRTASMPATAFDLETMIFDELLTVMLASDPRVVVAGPAVKLRDAKAEAMGLALHELVTNSIKFGALSGDGGSGRLSVHWTVEESHLRFEWVESGVAIVTRAPIRSGFGREFIEKALSFQLGAETSFEIVPGGLVARIRLPLAAPVAMKDASIAEEFDG